MATQLITPTPDIACRPGWCLEYVRKTFGLPGRYDSATEAWFESDSQHLDRDFPAGVSHAVWYGIVQEPLGHVVLRMADGTVYSTSDNNNTPHHHPSLEHLESYYAYYGMNLVYRGWTEDVASYPVIQLDGITAQGYITPIEEDEMKPEQMLELKLFIQSDNEARHLVTRKDVVRDVVKALGDKIDETELDLKLFEQGDSEARHLATRKEVDEARDAIFTQLTTLHGITVS